MWSLNRARRGRVSSLAPWLPVLAGFLLVLPISVTLVVVRVRGQAGGWHPLRALALSDTDLAFLAALLFLVAAPGMALQRRAWRHVQARERQARAAEAIQIENDAVARVCQAVAREFVQPLSGTLAYSELLLQDTASPSESQRRALDGLREGVSRLEYLVYSVRDAVTEEPMQAPGARMADSVVHAVRMPVPRHPMPARGPARWRP
ncbi:MAG TPA: hypothetical protein VNL35_13320 [Chloroflexota bacterium]|nr:hypothetical protein [Chloroflexota bacterium]